MASHVVVIDSSFRKCPVKVTPGSFMTDVLEEACAKFKLNSSNYGIKNNNKQVDLSRTFRQTGLPSGAKLELVAASRTPTAVQVALQIPEALAAGTPGGRLMDKFASNTTIWKILRSFEERQGQNLNFTARGITEIQNGDSGAGRIYYEMPSVNAMGRELSTFGDLQKTLAQLGFNGGTCLLRLSFKKTTQPLEEAMQEIGSYFKEEESAPLEKASTPSQPLQEPNSTVDSAPSSASNPAVAENDEDKDVEMTPAPDSTPSMSIVTVGESKREVSVFSPPSATMPQAALQPYNEQDYEPSIVHAKLHQARLLNNSQNKRLLSDAETDAAEREKAAKLNNISQVSLKIRFPDQSSLVSTFTSKESALDLYKFVNESIVAEDQPYKLVYTDRGPKTVPRDEKILLIKNLGFQGRVLVNFHWNDDVDSKFKKQPALKLHLRENAQELKLPEPPVVEEKEEGVAASVETDKNKETEGKPRTGKPKWFTMGKKK